MTENTPNPHLSYVLSITLPKPTIRIKIPKALAKAMQRRNHHVYSDMDDESGKNKKKQRRAGLRKKVGAVLSNVFGNNLNEGMQEMREAKDKGKEGEKSQGTMYNGMQVVKKGKINRADQMVETWKKKGVTTRWLGKLKVTWSEKQELCNKRILLGGKCKPLATIQYDENGFLLPES